MAMGSGRSIDVLGVGAVAVDDFIYVDTYPPRDKKTRVLGRSRQCGGNAATALVAAARLGLRCAYAGVLGKDALSEYALDCLQREGIDTSHARRTEAARPIHSTIVVEKRRSGRNIFFNLDGVVGAGERTPSASYIRSCRVLLIDHFGMRGSIRAARIARQAGIPVVADIESHDHPLTDELLPIPDHFVASETLAKTLTGERSIERAVLQLGRCPTRQVVVVTAGEKGCWYMAQGWPSPKHQPAFKVKVIDTTGCGDVFHGAYAAGLVWSMELEQRVRFAAAAAAIKATQAGGQAGIPSRPAVEALLAS